MTQDEKITALTTLISPDTADTDLLAVLLSQAEGIILERRYPFGSPPGAVIPPQYENIQLRIAVELYSKMGAEGQTQHDENGVKRTWESADVSQSLLRKIVPICGSVTG